MSAINIYGIMVIYNKTLDESKAFGCLKNQNIKLVVCDNSTVDNGNEQKAVAEGVDYIFMQGNKGLSVAYNRALDYIFQKFNPGPADYICIFDDDTTVPQSYFECLKKATGEILLPIVTDGVGIMSPVIMKNDVARRIASKTEVMHIASRHLSGINSGMAVRAGIYDNYRYNEEMFLDYIDHMFIIEMRKNGKYPEVIDVDISQQFSAIDDSKETAAKRFTLQKKDLKIFYKNNYAMYLYVIIKKHIKLVIKYKDIKMLFC